MAEHAEHSHAGGSHAGHVHGPTSGRTMWISLVVTLLFVIGEATAGIISHSLALLSDAGHNLSDALALGLAAYAIWVARKPANSARTFGYHRVAILTALFNAVSLVVLAIWIFIEAFRSFLHPEPVGGALMIWVALVAVLMNTVIAAALSGDAKHSINSRAAFVHMAGDALSSAAVVVAGVVIHYTHWVYADPLVSVLIAAFILYSAWGIVGDATNILMENTPKGIDVNKLVAEMKSVTPVCDVHDLHIWTVGDGLNFLSCHVALPFGTSLEHCAAVVGVLNKKLHDEYSIGHSTIQTEVEGICPTHEEAELYCAMESHQHGAGEEHDHDHSEHEHEDLR
jgi:cobalt-zinc-cadmium efflux system protein